LSSYEHIIRRTFNRFGLDIHRHRPEQSSIGRLQQMLSTHGSNVVFDVGANVGQFAKALRQAGYQHKIVSFEPLQAAHAELLRESQHDSDWMIAPRTAIGDHNGEISIHVAGNSVSSSALNMLESHVSAAPSSAYIGDEIAPLHTLDSQISPYLSTTTVSFLKIDTQGYEQHVLDGAPNLLDVVKGVQLELSLVPLYEGQRLFHDFLDYFKDRGFSIWSIEPGFSDPKLGRLLQVDVTFFRD
jgi:FkbM family methyltransferase